MKKELINEYANSIGIYKNLSEEFLDKLKLTTGCKRFIAEKKIKAISEELGIDLDWYILKLLDIFDYSDIHDEYVTENEINSVLPIILEIFNLLPPAGIKSRGRTSYGTAEERAKKLKQKTTEMLNRGISVLRKGLVTSIFSKRGTKSPKIRQLITSDPHKVRITKKALTSAPSGETLSIPKKL